MNNESSMDGTNRPSAQSTVTSQSVQSSPNATACQMDVDIDKLDYGGGTSPAPTLDTPDITSKGEQGDVAFTRDGERGGEMETWVPTPNACGVRWKGCKKLEVKLATVETRLEDTKKELRDEWQCAVCAIAEWSAERERLKAQLEKLFDERDELCNRVASMKKDYEELEEDNETMLAECVQLREELDRGPPSEDGKGKKAARSDLGDEDTVHQWDRHLLPADIETWKSIFETQKNVQVWPYGYSLFRHYLYSKEAPANRRSDLQKYAVANYKLYDWVSDILDAVGNNREPPSNLSAVQRYLKCSTGAITTYDPIELGCVIQYRQHSNVPGVEPLDDGWTLSKRHLQGAMLRQMVLPHNTGKSEGVDRHMFRYSLDTLLLEAMGVPGWYYARLTDFNIQVASELRLKQWEWPDNLSPVTEREFIQHLADLGVGIRILKDRSDYSRDLLMTMANSPQPMKHSDWTQQAATDIYERTRETEMPQYTVAAEDDVLLRNPTLLYPARSEYVPAYHMYEWTHPDRAISQNKCRPAKPENSSRRIKQLLQGTSLAYNISPTHPLAPRTGHHSQESTTNATVISRAPRLSTSTQYSTPAHHRSLANRIGPDTTESSTDVPRTPRVSASVLGLQTTTMETLDAAPHTNSTNDGKLLEYSNGFMDSSK
ncbi:hypothetical protein DFH07DRAFT_770172 [Mycena maculata]|uniref:Uncharacterized protein n=1 Tax=Mycena maculata TaxID=230809 RepID=A0AAD7NLH4_9AGAR|nr:hypothetical protein DFH07DRAFT_770172 [Mycena maculata]